MKKYNLNSFVKKICTILLGTSALYLSSCTNFLEGSDVKDNIDRAVEFANAKAFPLTVYSTQSETKPSGHIEKKVGEEVEIDCKPFNGYEFLCWDVKYKTDDGTVIDTSDANYNDEELNSIIQFEDRYSKSTTFTLQQEIENIEIQPRCENRPQVMATYPIFESLGVLQDSRIQVMFDHEMDPGSIYYTGEELLKLGISDPGKLLSGNSLINVYNLTIKDIDISDKIYGYIDTRNEPRFKNISIVDRSGKNILENFAPPFFERPDILIIPPSHANMPSTYTQFIASIDQNFYSMSLGKKITMSASKKWNYILNNQRDNEAPTKSNNTLAFEARNNSNNLIQGTQPSSSPIILSTIKDVNKPIHVKAIAKDELSGMADYFIIELTKIYEGPDKNFATVTTPVSKKTATVNYSMTDNGRKIFGSPVTSLDITALSLLDYENIDLQEKFPNLEDGIYKIEFMLMDINGNYDSTDTTCYGLIDHTAPTVTTPPTVTATDTTSATISWTKPTTEDFDSTKLMYRLAGSQDLFKTFTTYNNSYTKGTITGLTAGKQYEFAVSYKDTLGNESEPLSITSYTRPSQFSNFTLSKHATSPTQKIKITWDYPAKPDYSGIMFFYGTDSNIANSTYDDWWASTHTTRESSIPYYSTTLLPGTKYYVWTVSYAGTRPLSDDVKAGTTMNTGSPYCKQFATAPAPVTDLKASATTTSSVTLSWTNPTLGSISGHKIFYKKTSDSTWTEDTNITADTSRTSWKVDGLIAGTKYDFKVLTYYDTNTNESSQTTKSQYTKPTTARNVSVSRNTSNQSTSLKVTWTKPTSSYDGYGLFYSTGTSLSNANFAAWISKDTTSYTLTSLSSAKKYNVWVVPYSYAANYNEIKAGTSLTSNTGGSYASYYTAPADCVSGLKVTGTTTSSVTLGWTNPSTDYSGWRFYYQDKTAGSSSYTLYNSITKSSTPQTSYTISGLTAGHQYSFKVVTYIDTTSNESTTSSSVTHYTRPNCVSNVRLLTNATYPTTKLDVVWTNPTSGNFSGTMIMLGTDSNINNASYKGWNDKTVTSTTLDVTAGKNYYVWIVTWTEGGTSGQDIKDDNKMSTNYDSAAVTTVSSMSGNVSVSSPAQGSVKIDWTFPSSYTSYDKVYFYYGTTSTAITDGTAKCLDYWNTEYSTRTHTYSPFTSGKTYYFWVATIPSKEWLSTTDRNNITTVKNCICTARAGYYSVIVK